MCAADLAMAGGLLVLAPGFRRSGHQLKTRPRGLRAAPPRACTAPNDRAAPTRRLVLIGLDVPSPGYELRRRSAGRLWIGVGRGRALEIETSLATRVAA